ncbi:MAG: PASTA domain-containing protein [Bacteroidota bacterium]
MLRYFISREFFFTLLGLAGVGVLAYIAIFFWILPGYTRHGEGLLVPDVGEMTLSEAISTLEDEGLRPVAHDSIFDEELAGGVVLKQYPGPYSRVKPGRAIMLTINKSEPPMVAMPSVVDLTLYQAKSRLETWKLGIGRVTRVADIAKNAVLKASYEGKRISPGTKIPQGAKIDLEVGTGTGSIKVQIPDLIGYTYEDALIIIREMGLSLGSIRYNATGPEDKMDRIYSQNPRPGFDDSIAMGRPIDLYIYGEEPEANEGILIEEVDKETE